jgi:hypothetical protein
MKYVSLFSGIEAATVAYDLELIGYDLPCRGDAS